MRFPNFESEGKGEPDLSSVEKNRYKVDDESGKDMERKKTNKFVIACAVFASLKSILAGYDVGVMSGAIIFMKEDLNLTEMEVQFFVGSMSIFSLIGSLVGGKASDIIGRKWAMVTAAVIVQIGAAVMALASSIHTLLIGRFLSAIGIGISMLITPVYIAEISPNMARGSLTSFPSFLVNFGVLLGYVSNYTFSGLSVHTSWRIMLAIGILPSFFIILALVSIPESPRWLVMRNRVEKARHVLVKMVENPNEVEQRIVEMQMAGYSSHKEKAIWRELMNPSPSLRRMMVTGVGIMCFQQLTGINAILYYTPEILRSAGMSERGEILKATVAVGVVKSVLIMVAIGLIDRVGRKALLYWGAIGMTGCLLGLGVVLGTGAGAWGALVLVCGDVAFFAVGMGAVGWVVTAEIFPQRLRAQAAVVCAVGHRFSSGLVAMTFLSAARLITLGGVFFVYAALSAISVWFVYRFVPETKGKSLEQIELLFKDGNR